MHVDKHAVKMVLEYAQLLSTAHRVLDGKLIESKNPATGRMKKTYVLPDNRDTLIYSATHINHPSAVWARYSAQNYNWLSKLLLALCKEYTYRYEKVHKIERDGLAEVLCQTPNNISRDIGFTEPTPAMPDEYKVPGDSILSYKQYYIGEKTRMFNWKKRSTPEWIIENAYI